MRVVGERERSPQFEEGAPQASVRAKESSGRGDGEIGASVLVEIPGRNVRESEGVVDLVGEDRFPPLRRDGRSEREERKEGASEDESGPRGEVSRDHGTRILPGSP